MTFILISGKPDVGKTRVCNRLHGALGMNGTFILRDRQPSKVACPEDYITHYEKGDKHIVINSPSDGDKCMLEFAQYLDNLAQKGVLPDIIVTTIRENDDINEKEYPMSHMLALLDAIADGKSNLVSHYNQNIANITTFAPTAIKCHAFVLHLEEQTDVKNADDKTKALIPYCDDNADKLKYIIDFALARP